MMTLRKSADRGTENLSWLNTKYSFSFANYYDPERVGFKSLRVSNLKLIIAKEPRGGALGINQVIKLFGSSAELVGKNPLI